MHLSLLKSADADDSGAVDLADAVTILNFLFRRGRLPEPVASCGVDDTDDELPCDAFAACPLP